MRGGEHDNITYIKECVYTDLETYPKQVDAFFAAFLKRFVAVEKSDELILLFKTLANIGKKDDVLVDNTLEDMTKIPFIDKSMQDLATIYRTAATATAVAAVEQ